MKKLKNYKGAIRDLAKDYGWEYKLAKEDKFNADESKTFKERVAYMRETVKTELNKIRERPSILFSLDKLHHEIRTEIIKGQDTVALSICLFSVFLGMILVNQGAFGYPPNFINNKARYKCGHNLNSADEQRRHVKLRISCEPCFLQNMNVVNVEYIKL